jgi:ribonucleoside-diphosphate reductase alpha chain
MDSIMQRATEAAETMRRGGGIGYDFSRLRPRGDRIKSLDSKASGAVSFMQIFDAVCQTIASSGHRRGAQMGVIRIDHPDIEQFITTKNDGTSLSGFNISVGVTDESWNASNKRNHSSCALMGRSTVR